jgi:hypothetical protein
MADQNMVRDPESGLMLDALAQRNLANNGSFEEQVKIQGIAPLPGPTDEFMGPVTMPESNVAKKDLDNFLKLRKTNPVSTLTKPQKDTASQILRDYTTASLQLNAAPGETLPDNFELPPYSENFAPLFDQNFPVIKSTDDLLANGLIDDNGATTKGLLVLDLKKIGALNDDYTLNLTGKALLSNPQEATKPENLAIFMERKRLELDEPEDRSWSDSWKDFKKVLGSAADTLESLIPSGAMPMPSGTSMPMGAYIPPNAEVGYTAEKKAILEGAASGIVQQESSLALGAKKLGQDILTKILMEGDEQEIALAALDQKYQRDKQQISAFRSSEALHEITGLTNWVDQMEQVKTELGDEKFKAAQKTGLEGGPMLYSALNPLSAENMAFRVAMSATMAPVKMVSGQMLRARQTAEAFAEQTQSLNAANAAIAKAQATIRFGEKIPELEKAQQAFQVAGDLASAKSIGRNIEKVRSASQKAVFEMEQWGSAASKITQNLERLSANAASANRIVKVADTFAQWPKVITTPVGFTLQKVGQGMTFIDSNLAAASDKLGAGKFYRGMTKLSSLAGVGTIGQVAGLPGELAWFPAVFKAAWSTAPAIEATGDFIRLVGREASAARGAIPMWRKIYRAQNAGTTQKLIAGLMDTATLGGLPVVQNAVKGTIRGTAAGIPLDMAYNYVSSGGDMPPGSLKDSIISNAFFAGGGAAIGAVRVGSRESLKQFQMGDVLNFRRSITDADQRMAFDALPRGVRDSIGSYSGANPNLGIRFVKEGGGNFNSATNTVYINPNAKNPLKPLLAHELLESMVSRTSMSTSIATILVGDGVQTGGLLRDRNGNLDPDFVEFRDRYNQLRQAEVNRMNQVVEPDKRESFTPLTDREMAKEYFIEMNADDMAAMAESGKLGQLAARTIAARKLVDLGNTILNKASIIKNLHFNMGGMMDSSGRMVTGNGLLADGIKQLPEAKALFQKMVNETAGRPGAVKKMAEKAQGTVIPTSGMDDPIWSEMTSYWKTDKAGNPIKDSSGNWVPLERYVEQAREQAGLLIQADQKQRIANGEVIPKHEIQYSPESGWRGKYFSESQINIIKDSGYFNDSQIRLFDHVNNAAKRGQGERFLMIYNPATSSRLRSRGRKSYETLGPTMKEGGILGFSMGQKGQILIDIIDTQQLHQNVMEQAGKKFGQLLYKGDIDKIMTDINAVMDLHSQGLPADSHFVQNYGDKWKDYKNFINSTFGDISGGAKARPADYLMINPVLVTDRPSRAVFKTYRLDRLNKATRMEGTTGIPMDYNMVKANYMPEGTPLFTEDGDPVDMRYTPVEDSSGNLRAEPSKNYGKSNESQLDEQGTPVAMDQLPEQARQMPESLDADYMKAVESGDVEAQQRMVDAAAKAAGFNVGPLYHGSENFKGTKLENPNKQFTANHSFWFTDDIELAEYYAGYPDEPRTLLSEDQDGPAILQFYIKDPDLELDRRNYEGEEFKEKSPVMDANLQLSLGRNQVVKITNIDDKIDSEVVGDSTVYGVRDADLARSADPILRDSSGNVIPLSQRFNEKSSDIRYMPEPVSSPAKKKKEIVEQEDKGIQAPTGSLGELRSNVEIKKSNLPADALSVPKFVARENKDSDWKVMEGPLRIARGNYFTPLPNIKIKKTNEFSVQNQNLVQNAFLAKAKTPTDPKALREQQNAIRNTNASLDKIGLAVRDIEADPQKFVDPKGYAEVMKKAGVTGDVLIPPSSLKMMLEDPDAFTALLSGGYHADKTVAGIRESAMSGLDSVVEMRELIGGRPPDLVTAIHHLWGTLSKQLPPLQQEALWMRMITNKEVMQQIGESINGTFSQSPSQWKDTVKKARINTVGNYGKLGNNATSNANSFYLMLYRHNGKWGEVSDVYKNNDAVQMRYDFNTLGHGATGIKNKVQSFIGLTFGIKGNVLDRWRFVDMYLADAMKITGAKTPRDYFKYEGKGKNVPVDKIGIYKNYGTIENKSPLFSLAMYSGMDRVSQAAIDASPSLKTLLGNHADPGGLHWLSWNAIKNEAVGHSSLDITKNFIKAYNQDGKFDKLTVDNFLKFVNSTEAFVEGTSGGGEEITRLTLKNGVFNYTKK